ncbi:MAG: hypothetical protein KC586_17220, partial [Myxococcales bacterium]|nr:hypothetical protein [Myxococcales bacterium]
MRWPVLFGAGHSHFGFDFASGYRSGLSGRTLVAGGEPMADELLRGVALVDAVMAHRRAKGETLEGMDAATLEKTTLGGRALTPALRRWLEQDAAMFELADPEPLQSFLENEFGEEWAEMFDPLGEMLTEPVVMFDG